MVLQPGSSEALCHLGNGQLMLFEVNSEQAQLREAELSFRASIAMEGHPISAPTIPQQLSEQQWWQTRSKPAASSPQKPSTAPTVQQKSTPSAAGGKGTAPAATRPAGGASRQPGSRQPAKAAAAAAASKIQPAAARGPAKPAQTGARKATGPQSRQQMAASTPAKQQAGAGRKVAAGRTGQGGGMAPATLGELKAGTTTAAAGTPKAQQSGAKEATKSPSQTSPPAGSSDPPAVKSAGPAVGDKAKLNQASHHARLGLARTLARSTDPAKIKEAATWYREVMKMTPEVHDAYIELGEMLARTDALAAVEVYTAFPFTQPPSFDDAYLQGEIVRLLMESESYDDPRLCSSMIALGQALGVAVLERRVAVLEAKFKTALLKKVYAGVHGKPVDDPDLVAFFKFKCWT